MERTLVSRAAALAGAAVILVAAGGCSCGMLDLYHPPDAAAEVPETVEEAADQAPDAGEEDAAPGDPPDDDPAPDAPADPPADDARPDDPPLDAPADDSRPEAVDARPDGADARDVVESEPSCVPGSRWCDGTTHLVTCSPDGGIGRTECAFGCAPGTGSSSHCKELVPSNLPDASLLCVTGTGPLALPGGTVYVMLDTDDGSIIAYDSGWREVTPRVRVSGPGLIGGINFAARPSPGAGMPGLGVFSFRELSLPSGVMLFALGSNAAVVLACDSVSVAGTFYARAVQVYSDEGSYYAPGPGGGDAGMGTGAGTAGAGGSSTYQSGGGGGAGFGGAGGNGSGASGAGTGGRAYGSDTLVPLRGGSGGGAGGDNYGGRGAGGPGGGALQVTTKGNMTISGIIDAGGWGGLGASPGAGGGGAGSGGGILLEARSITVAAGGKVVANGGGGGSGGVGTYTPGNDGERGHPTIIPAPGGADADPSGDTSCAGAPGNSMTAIAGATLTCASINGGGGGGGAGRLRFNAPVQTIPAGTTSPSLTASPTSATTGLPNAI